MRAHPTLRAHLHVTCAIAVPSHRTDGESPEREIASWNVTLPPTAVALTCDEVRGVFVGRPLARGIALQRLTPVQIERLFPGRSQRKGAHHLLRFARRIQGEEARAKLANASWHQLRAAAAHDTDDAQIHAAVLSIMGIRGPAGSAPRKEEASEDASSDTPSKTAK
ncbi:MAG: hypothetical protein U0441_30280 [Polyangiaceae bacterium]